MTPDRWKSVREGEDVLEMVAHVPDQFGPVLDPAIITGIAPDIHAAYHAILADRNSGRRLVVKEGRR